MTDQRTLVEWYEKYKLETTPMAHDTKRFTTIADVQRAIDEINLALMNRPTTAQVTEAITVSSNQTGDNPAFVTNERMRDQEERLSVALEELRGLSATLEATVKEVVLNELTADDISDGVDKVMMLLTERAELADVLVAVDTLVSQMASLTARVVNLEQADLDIYDAIDDLEAKDVLHEIDISALQTEQGQQRIEIDDIHDEQIVQDDRLDDIESDSIVFQAHVDDISGNPHFIDKVKVALGNLTNDLQLRADQLGVPLGVAPLDAGGKVPAAFLPQNLIFVDVWNADTNTPTLTSGVGTEGYFYVVSVAGSTNLDGETDWKPKDWAIFVNGAWRKVDNTESVSTVNGQTGVVNLDIDYYKKNLYVNISAGVPDGAKPILTNVSGKVDISFISQNLIDHSLIGNSGTISHNDIDILLGAIVDSSVGLADAAKLIKLNVLGYLDHTLQEAPINSFAIPGGVFAPVVSTAIKSLKSTVDADFIMTDIVVSDGKYDGQRVRVRFTQGVTGGDITSWGVNFVGSNLIPLNSIGLSVLAGETDLLTFEWDADRSKWMLVGFLDKVDA